MALSLLQIRPCSVRTSRQFAQTCLYYPSLAQKGWYQRFWTAKCEGRFPSFIRYKKRMVRYEGRSEKSSPCAHVRSKTKRRRFEEETKADFQDAMAKPHPRVSSRYVGGERGFYQEPSRDKQPSAVHFEVDTVSWNVQNRLAKSDFWVLMCTLFVSVKSTVFFTLRSWSGTWSDDQRFLGIIFP